MTPTLERRIYDLFVRYWDGALTVAEADELDRLLETYPVARTWFEEFVTQAVVAAELPACVPAAPDQMPLLATERPARAWSRRRALAYLGGGLAAGVAGVVLGRRFWADGELVHLARTVAPHGTVGIQAADGRPVRIGSPVPPGATVTTRGMGASVALAYSDGSSVTLVEDAVVTVGESGRQLTLHQGTATADVRPQPAGADPLDLTTPRVALPGLSAAVATLHGNREATDVQVHHGAVAVATSTGAPIDVVRQGETLTVQAAGDFRKHLTPVPPSEYAWDLTRPLPADWEAGTRMEAADGPVVRAERWFDPHHKQVMSEIRCDPQWARGLFRLYPDSVVRVRYWVDRPGHSQMLFCVRGDRPPPVETAVVERRGAFTRSRPMEWQWLEVSGAEMVAAAPRPVTFAAPWTAFRIVFNTFTEDIGLRVASFQVTRSV